MASLSGLPTPPIREHAGLRRHFFFGEGASGHREGEKQFAIRTLFLVNLASLKICLTNGELRGII
jgi:hypothetical protein